MAINRRYQPEDAIAVEALMVSAFTDSENAEEGAEVGRLASDMMRDADSDDIEGFVAELDGEIVGAIFFSRMWFQSALKVFILSPVAVATAHQGRGIGQALITYGLQVIKSHHVDYAMTYGDPGYYGQVGFQPVSTEDIPPPFTLSQPHGWLGQSLGAQAVVTLEGPCTCVKALDEQAYW